MGLAASQSRFLLLTARKNNLSSQMMSLTNQNMALQRQQSILSQDYEKKQNAQYVTYNDELLDYSSLMQPGGVTGANQMFTSSAGEVLLSDRYRSKLGKLGGTSGSGAAFMKAYSEDAFLKTMLPGYDPVYNNGTGNKNVDSTTSTKTTGVKATSAFKYDDNVMNNAIVYVQPSSVIDIGGYGASEEEGGDGGGDTVFEFAMGTQQNNVNSLACINTLDDYQYTQPNIHAVVNEFVSNSTTAMSGAMTEQFGTTDAINKALEYATKMTQELYTQSQVYATSANVVQCVKYASAYEDAGITYDCKTASDQFRESQIASVDAFYSEHMNELDDILNKAGVNTAARKQQIKMHQFDDAALYAYAHYVTEEVPLNSTGILVSESPYVISVTSNPDPSKLSVSFEKYTGKNVFVNTAQLTATFLNFFDAEMNRQLGTNEGDYYGNTIEKMALGAVNQLALRENLQTEGIVAPAYVGDASGDTGRIVLTAKDVKGMTSNSIDDIKLNPGEKKSVTGITYAVAADAAYAGNSVPMNLLSAARAAIGITNTASNGYNVLYQPTGSANDVWSVLGNEAKEQYEKDGTISMTDANGLKYTINVLDYAKDLPTYCEYVVNGTLLSDSIEHTHNITTGGQIVNADYRVVGQTYKYHYYYGNYYGKADAGAQMQQYNPAVTQYTNTTIGGRTYNVNPTTKGNVVNYAISGYVSGGTVVRVNYAQANVVTYANLNNTVTSGSQLHMTGPVTTVVNGQTVTGVLKVDEARARNVAMNSLTISNVTKGEGSVIPNLETVPISTVASNLDMEYKKGTLEAGQSITVQANFGDYMRFSIAGGMVEYSLDENTYTDIDSSGNRTWTITNHAAVAQDYAYYQTKINPEEDAKMKNNKTASGGTKVSGVIGDSNLLSSNFSNGAAGVFGSLNKAGEDFYNYSTGSTASSGTSGNNEITYNDVQFYKSLYSALATGGWKFDSQLNKSSYLSQQMLQGNILLNTFASSTSWKAMQLGDSNGLATVEDKETREKAKAEYEAQNSILETRKTFLENQIQTLQTQSDAIDTEKDSLKSLIEKEQEKFKLFV